MNLLIGIPGLKDTFVSTIWITDIIHHYVYSPWLDLIYLQLVAWLLVECHSGLYFLVYPFFENCPHSIFQLKHHRNHKYGDRKSLKHILWHNLAWRKRSSWVHNASAGEASYVCLKSPITTWKGIRTDREKSLAVAWAMEKFHHSLYGKHFTLETDHKPLETILNKPVVEASPRLRHIITHCLLYDLTVKYIKGKTSELEYWMSCLPSSELSMNSSVLPLGTEIPIHQWTKLATDFFQYNTNYLLIVDYILH